MLYFVDDEVRFKFWNKLCNFVCSTEVRYRIPLKKVEGVQNLTKMIIRYFTIRANDCFLEAVVQRCSAKKVFLEISQNSQENTCARVSFLIKFVGLGLQIY